jgi:hypothetical protein
VLFSCGIVGGAAGPSRKEQSTGKTGDQRYTSRGQE